MNRPDPKLEYTYRVQEREMIDWKTENNQIASRNDSGVFGRIWRACREPKWIPYSEQSVILNQFKTRDLFTNDIIFLGQIRDNINVRIKGTRTSCLIYQKSGAYQEGVFGSFIKVTMGMVIGTMRMTIETLEVTSKGSDYDHVALATGHKKWT